MRASVLAFYAMVAITVALFPDVAFAECQCGDVDCSGQLDLDDGMYLMEYLFGGGAPPLTDDPGWADWDNHEGLTIGDVYENMKYVFSGPPPVCPPAYPPHVPVIDSTTVVYYTDWFPRNVGSTHIALTLKKESATQVLGLSLPLKIRVDGEIPTIDSVVFLCDDCLDSWSDYTDYGDSGCIAIGGVPFLGWPPGDAGQFALIYLSVPPASTIRPVTLEWVSLTPIQAPTEDSSIIPMIYSTPKYYELPPIEPLLEPHCCLTPGDVNMDGTINIGDAVFLIQCIFVDCLGHPCEKHLDANCDGVWNVADVVYLINYIFRGGPPPCCL
jgi:hypothetical protein